MKDFIPMPQNEKDRPLKRSAPTTDRIENIENRETDKANGLFQKILEDFSSTSSFTLEDIDDAYNKGSEERDHHNSYGKKELDTLVTDGLLDFDSETGIYEINHASERVANFEMGEEMHHTEHPIEEAPESSATTPYTKPDTK